MAKPTLEQMQIFEEKVRAFGEVNFRLQDVVNKVKNLLAVISWEMVTEEQYNMLVAEYMSIKAELVVAYDDLPDVTA